MISFFPSPHIFICIIVTTPTFNGVGRVANTEYGVEHSLSQTGVCRWIWIWSLSWPWILSWLWIGRGPWVWQWLLSCRLNGWWRLRRRRICISPYDLNKAYTYV